MSTSDTRPSEARAQIGVTGLAVMGRNLARNLARHGHTVALHNRTQSRTDDLVAEYGHEGDFVPSTSLEMFVASLERPRRVVIMVKAGDGTDAVIHDVDRSPRRPIPRQRHGQRRRGQCGHRITRLAVVA